jgi:hypothetical protein
MTGYLGLDCRKLKRLGLPQVKAAFDGCALSPQPKGWGTPLAPIGGKRSSSALPALNYRSTPCASDGIAKRNAVPLRLATPRAQNWLMPKSPPTPLRWRQRAAWFASAAWRRRSPATDVSGRHRDRHGEGRLVIAEGLPADDAARPGYSVSCEVAAHSVDQTVLAIRDPGVARRRLRR